MAFKNPNTVLIVIYAKNTNRVLMLQRKDDPDFWQSVSGSLEPNEKPYKAAIREVTEETGFQIKAEHLCLFDCKKQIEFEIFPHFRYKYAPSVTHCREHWFLLALPEERIPTLAEHLAYQWLDPEQAAELTKSPNNSEAIKQYLIHKSAV
ncbi:dihydroneopterin triphosphate diphosphatase [Pasteurella bettyae]|uniref:Dihydroneopterin triphosphate pyrophosphatase n=1 Tax=Pasteurella bettyae CCUG 2042 TaxID=1095749 RepID=I3DHJ6_9PAST|nr:dihydroneopterin triphosphate diphosphatase [Pasteurella bettyae]EIJ71189.1 dihydroneopterin triphosphate pyrophosphatase [Pasteurella bettyae CCUG 2042]